MSMTKGNNWTNKINNKTDYNVILTSRFTDRSGGTYTNYYQWYRNWGAVRIGTYGAIYREQFINKKSPKIRP
jgi:hypothetical protein